ncbi:MAG: linked oxidase domain protein [Thermomicrobiales bacterium]|jgi:FAD/FMN-containing dehydrogenase|nr:linked oxidase domain protein [Thermomicrobiales bacterium]MDF2969504.1 linked oxidase domain protein [Nocardioidaceae bacterium]
MTIGAVDRTALDQLRSRFTGDIILPDDPGYDAARTLFNAMIDKRPEVIAQCASVDDIVAAIRFARENSLEIAVRGGGHSVAGKALTDGGLVIDLRRMNRVVVDPERRTATVGGGATMGDLDRGTQPYGLATTGGRVSTTGVGGFTLGGGSGWLDRKFGLACDNLLAAELVLADGRIVHASETENPDLFWALHGGGGNFGVVTAFTFRLHPLSAVTAALLLWQPEAGPDIARAYRDFIMAAPDEVGGGLIYFTGPAEDFVPPHLVGQLVCAVLVTYAGPEDDARRAMAPMLELGHEGELIVEVPYAELQSMLDDPPGYRNYWTAEYLDAFPDEAIDRFCARAYDMVVPSPSQHVLFPQRGAVGRGSADYPIPWRRSPWCVHPFGLWEDPADDERGRRWARDMRADLQPWASGAVLLNFIGDEGQDRVMASLGQENYERLATIKARYDPDNIFHLNHNITPNGAG